ncbi:MULTISPECIES: hypothetical protein [Chryseobacterium]|uniref:Uncharacterized protein n=1 Tax=Chryseobacterium nepalense TaxID=1854498 RepID=A0ABY4K1I8_9FLAO|nr:MULTISPECIES: hypothetical protein [Chryseobacterium]MEA1850745.1 hypothetical protein [Chryseobacterium sp. MHB01]UPQ74658.1 hypothetical protein M0D58_11420 [Chryseobacterium nepalense]
MKKTLGSLNSKKIKKNDLIAVKGGLSNPGSSTISSGCDTLVMTGRKGDAHPSNDGTCDDSDWAC